MTERPAFRVHGEEGARLSPRGCAMVLAALDAALKLAGRGGVDYRGRTGYSDFEWLRETCRLGAQPGPPASATGSQGQTWRLDMPSSASIVSTQQAAAILGLTSRSVVAAIKRGELPATRVGRRTWALAEVDVRMYAGRNGRADASSGTAAR